MDTPMKTHDLFDVSCNKKRVYKTKIELALRLHRNALGKRGFTLLELLVVVAIVAVLAIIALPSYAMLKDLAKNARAETEVRMLEKGISLFVVDNNALPNNLTFLPEASRIDPWGHNYEYYKISSPNDANAYAITAPGVDQINTDYDLYSKGKNGQTTLALPDSTSTDDIVRCGELGKVVLAQKYDDQ
jgi:general secretion pathway protein G